MLIFSQCHVDKDIQDSQMLDLFACILKYSRNQHHNLKYGIL